jgi:hypothetical protein
MQLRALTSVVGMSLVACAVGTSPTVLHDDPLSSGGTAGTEAAAGSSGAAGDSASSGASSGGAGGGSTAGSGGMSGAGAGGGGAGGAGAGGGGAGGGGAGGSAGKAGTAGAGGMPNQPEPSAITVSTTKNATAKHSPSTGGTAYTDDCPAGQVLIGFRGTIDGGIASLRSVAGVCATLSVGANSPYAITTTQAGMLPVRMSAGNTVENAMCPANQVIIGFSGRTAMYIEALIFRCAPLTITGTAPNYELEIGSATDTSPIGGENAGSTFNAINCAGGQVAVSQVPNAGSAIDNFGLRCSEVSLVVD